MTGSPAGLSQSPRPPGLTTGPWLPAQIPPGPGPRGGRPRGSGCDTRAVGPPGRCTPPPGNPLVPAAAVTCSPSRRGQLCPASSPFGVQPPRCREAPRGAAPGAGGSGPRLTGSRPALLSHTRRWAGGQSLAPPPWPVRASSAPQGAAVGRAASGAAPPGPGCRSAASRPCPWRGLSP